MNNNTTWFQIFVTLGAGMLSVTNPRVEAKCQAAGGQVLARPGNVSSCLYPTAK